MEASYQIGLGVPRQVATALGQLGLRQVGEGKQDLVLWPSIFCDSHIYAGLVARLGHRFRFHLVDGPGHGASEGPHEARPMADYAAALGEVLAQLGLDKPLVGGTSWGGLTGAELALRHPERVAGLVLMNTPLHLDSNSPSLTSRFITLGSRWMLGQRFFRDGVARSFFSPERLAANPTYAEQFHAMLKAADARALAAAVRAVLLESEPLAPRLKALEVPTLLIAGERDDMYPLEGMAEAALSLQAGTFAPVPGKHIAPIEATEAVAEALASWVDTL